VGNERAWVLATRIALVLLGALLVLLIVTGVLLTFRYRPELEFANVQSLDSPRHVSTLRAVHRVGGSLFLAAIVAYAVAGIGLLVARHRPAATAFPVLAVVVAAFASFSGYLLPWDQLSLHAVTVGTNIRGYRRILRGTNINYVLVGRTEIGTAAFSRWYWVHSVGVPVVLLALVAGALLFSRGPAPES